MIGITVAAVNKGHKLVKSQSGFTAVNTINAIGNATEAAIEPSETYRQIKTNTTQTKTAIPAQMV